MSLTKKVLLSLAASALLAAAAISFVGVKDIFNAVTQTGWPAFLTLGATTFLLMATQAAAWARLEREIGYRPRFRTLYSATLVAMAGNIILPSAHLGGEPAKILYAGRNAGIPYTRLAGTVLLCKYIEAMSFVLFSALAAIASLVGLRGTLLAGAGRPLGLAIIALTLLAILFCIVMALALARRWTPLTRIVYFLARIGLARHFFNRLRHRCIRMELWASRVFREERHAVPAALGWYLLTCVTIFIRPLVFFYLGWKIPLSPAELSLLFLAGQIMLAIQFMPSGIGTLDGGIVGAVALAAMAPSLPQCAAFLLCVRFWDAIVVLIGMSLAARTGIGLFRKAPLAPLPPAPLPPLASQTVQD